MTFKWCSLSKSPNTYVNTIKKTFWVVSSGVEFHLCLLVQNAVSTQFHIAGRCTFQGSLLCWSLQRLFSSVSEPHLPDLYANIIWRNRSLHLTCNCTTPQVVEIVPADALHNHHWAFGHLENTISNRYHKTQSFQSTNWDEISFKLRYIPHFNSCTISSNILIRSVPIPSTLHGWSSPITAKHLSSFSKLENQSLFGRTW